MEFWDGFHGFHAWDVFLVQGKVRAIPESSPSSSTCPSPGYDCHVSSGSSQYYVYEVSGAGAAERPRQVCPYVLLSCQYRPPREMPAPAPPRPAEQNHQEPQSPLAPCPWRGQLCIGGQRLCTIGLRSQHSAGTVPAQLPPSLDIKHVMGLSDLKKKLPEAAFGTKNYTENEVCFQGVHSSLYEVEISNKDPSKMDLLLENLREKDLAIIKYLQDQGVLILLTSSALAREDGLEPKEPVSLLALFLFSSPRALSPREEQQQEQQRARPSREGSSRGSLSLRIASVLPGLRYALRKAAASSCGTTGSPRLQEHLQEYAELQESSRDVPSVPVPSPCPDGDAGPCQEFSEQSLARLRRYLSDPGSFTLGISAALQCLRGAARNVAADPGNSSSSSSSSSEPPSAAPCTRSAGAVRDERELPAPERALKSVTSPTKPWGRELRRKSSRILGKNVPAPRAQTPPGEGSSRSREAAKKKTGGASSGPRKSGSAGNPNEPMLKLANLQLPHGRKRGAEVLAAEIVHKPQCESAEEEEESSAPNGPAVEAKRPKTLENLDTKKVPVTESGTTRPGKSKVQKNVENRAAKPHEKQQEESERKEQPSELPGEAPSQPRGAEIPGNAHPMAIPSAAFALPGDNSDSHALNLLADLALGSCIPAFIPEDPGLVPAQRGDSSEQQSPSDPKSLRAASDHKYHRADRQGKKPACSKASQSQALPAPADPSPLASPPREKSSGIVSRSGAAAFQAFPPRPAPPACEPSSHSIISAEHSYASPLPEDPRAPPDPRGSHPRSAPAAPLVGKVLPFRHQQSGAAEPARGRSCAGRKEEFSRSRTVSLCGSSVKVTCRWEEEYLFHLDSRYTNDALEKTVIRALHGPWDPDLPDDVEGMKLILHMWVALFYRKPSKLLSSSRKVVEHSNPSKFVSISSSGGFLELSDDSQDCFGFETCPADSGWDPDQTPSSSLDPSPPCQGPQPQPQRGPAGSRPGADGAAAVDSTVSSSSGELPCGDQEEEEEEQEPSSTSCPESLSLQEEQSLGVEPEGDARAVSSVTNAEEEEKKENEELEDEGSFTGPVGLVLSESSDAEMECEQNPGNSASPEQFGVPEQDPAPSPTSLAPPCPDRVSLAPSGGAGAVPAGFPEEVPPNQGQLPDPWDALGTPASEPNGAGAAEPDSVTDSPGPAGATERDPAPSAEPWEPARSPGSPCRPGESLALSPDTSSVCPASPSAAMDPWGAPERQPTGSLRSPSPSSPGRRGGGDADASPDSLGPEESNQAGNGGLVEEQLGSPSGNGLEELDDPVGAGDGRDSPFECTGIGDECGAKESGDAFPGTENSPGSDATNTEMAETPPHHRLLEAEPSSSISEAISATQELPRQQRSFPDIQGDSAPASPAAGVSSAGVGAAPGRRESVLCRLWKPGREGGAVQGEIPASPILWDEPGDPSGEFSDAEDILDVLPREERLPSQDTREGLAFEDPLENSFGDSDQEYLEGNSRSPLPSRSSCIVRSVHAAGARTTWDSSSGSSEPTEEPGQGWHWDIPRDSGGIVVTRQCPDRVAHSQPPRRRSRRARESHLARSLLGTWRGLQEITQHTLDMECLRFHYKLKEILRDGKPPFPTSGSLFPTACPARAPLSPRSRSPLRVTIPPSDGWPRCRRDPRAARRGRARSRERGAALRLARLRHRHRHGPEPRGDGHGDGDVAGDVAGILREFSEFQRLLLAGSAAPGQGERGGARPGLARPRGPAELRGTVAELCGALRCHLRRVAAGRQPGMFYLLESGREPFFDRAKALLEARGFVSTEPLSFCSARRGDSERLLVIVRNQDIASHIHTVPCLLELKRCPSVVFAGVDEPEEVTGDTFQELFQAGGFVVSDEELLERVTLGQLKEVVKLLEKLNRSGRWRWLLHHRESKQLRGDLRADGSAQRKQQLLRWCQGAELLELLPFHGCDAAAEPRRAQCLLGLQAQHVRARFAVFLTENPSSSCREMLESKGILVADISTFLGTVQKVAAPFRRSYW
ncbi:protein TASOR 2 [Passerculus sandwichensis]